jgi:hypothetical protein
MAHYSWRGNPMRVTTTQEATAEQINSLLRRLAGKQLDLGHLRIDRR